MTEEFVGLMTSEFQLCLPGTQTPQPIKMFCLGDFDFFLWSRDDLTFEISK
jgi:hypothetical protein